jgi:hypothetical protein
VTERSLAELLDPVEDQPADDPARVLAETQLAAMQLQADALVHQTEAAAMMARSLQAQVAALLSGTAPPVETTRVGPPAGLTLEELAQAQAVLGGGKKVRSHFMEAKDAQETQQQNPDALGQQAAQPVSATAGEGPTRVPVGQARPARAGEDGQGRSARG